MILLINALFFEIMNKKTVKALKNNQKLIKK